MLGVRRMNGAFASSFLYSIFLDHDPDEGALPECTSFLNDIHLPEVLTNNPGFVQATRYELVNRVSGNQKGPRWLSCYEIDGQLGADLYIRRAHGPREGR